MSLELLKTMLPFAGAVIGAVSGAYFKAWFDSQQERRRLHSAQQQTRWLPLVEASRAVRMRFDDLSAIYRRKQPNLPFTPETLAADFRELYMLSREEFDLEASDANVPRTNVNAVQKVRTRMAHHLNYAASSLYFTAAYLGRAERVSRALAERSLVLADSSRTKMLNVLSAVRNALQGSSGAGIPWEEQESVAEMAWTTNNSMISYFEFRKRLLELPGWEQFMGLFRFFVRFEPQIDYEVAATIKALSKLEDEVNRLYS
jgi:hypothetical protein